MTDEQDYRAIEQIYVRYCELVDEKQFDLMGDVFTPDCRGDYSQSLGEGVITPDLATLIGAMHHNLGAGSQCGPTHHNVGNFRIKLDGDKASAKVHYYAVHEGLGAHQGEVFSMWGEYRDDLIRTPAGWRVADRVYICRMRDGPDVTAGPEGA